MRKRPIFLPLGKLSPKRGFALIVTLTLMVLLTIIALGLLSMSSIALRSTDRNSADLMARANARMALMMAIGQLQREMGPDSRISAPHDLGNQADAKPRWVGVWDAWKSDPTASDIAVTPQSRVPTFRSWLVSGANGTGVTTGDVVKMVDAGSLGGTPAPEDLVSAPLVDISNSNRNGQIAWWTSDESVKAKVNAGGEASLASNPLSDSQSPRHVGHKAVAELAGFDWKPGQRSISVSTGEVNLAAGLGTAGVGRLNHDVTVHSNGVLTDVSGGHLKRDLSNLLSRPIAELQDKPLYLADGRINRFQIASDGSISNSAWAASNGIGADRWGINLEELHLFHEIHREVDWGGGKPQLVNKGSQSEIFDDRFSMYRIPTLEAVSLILAFIATDEPKPTPTAATTYRIDATMDVIVSLSNPNDIPTVWPAGLAYRVDTEGFPYRPRWNIQRPPANTVVHSHTVQEINSGVFGSSILGGFTLEAGEAAVFGAAATSTSSQNVNLTRGYAPRGALKIADVRWDSNNNWNPATDGLRATRLLPTDKMDFTMVPSSGGGNTPSGWLSSYARIGSSGTKIRNFKFGGGGNSAMTTAPANTYMPSSIRPQATSTPTVRDFIGKPMPVLMVTTMSNVERSRTALTPPNALPSRPYLLHEPATATMTFITNQAGNVLPTMQSSQLVAITETMDYAFGNDRTMAAGTGGRNLYHGGAREVGLGGNFYVVKRRIPLAAPLSLGAFENAIACGFDLRTGLSLNGNANNDNARNQNLDPNTLPHNLPTLPKSIYRGPNTGWEPRASMLTLAKSIGNSWTNPFLASDRVQDGTYHDQSWMANTALWDSWFLSGITSPGPSGAWGSDSRSQRQQFMELAERTAPLRNARLTYHPHKATTEALAELFNGDNLKPEAIDKLTKYLLVDGAFNVNSTSETAWKAFLTSVREQELLDANGAASKKDHPFGTLGHAVKSATTGAEGDWAGFRDLSDSEIDELANAIVTEVKARGPFLNMADFVNRRPDSGDATHRALGALQAAIDKSGLNERFATAGRSLAPADVPMFAGKDTLSSEPASARAAGAAGFLSQGALLTALGSQVTVRGDTFIIRAYGDSRDASGKIIQSKAWCEAVVQRAPEYVDPTNPPEASTGLSAANTTFGRKFNIVSFRWLSQDEI